MKTRFSILALVAVAFVIGLFLSVRPAEAVPPVSWQPEPFDVAVPPAGRLSTIVTARISRDIPATRVDITPSLAPYVTSIEPGNLPALTRGSEVTITLVFEVATGTPRGVYEGTLHLRQASGRGNGTQARPLPMKLTVGVLLYPPDPGEAGKETLEGIDSDGDGVRDDIQRYIELTYPNEPAVRDGLRQYSIHLQSALLDAGDEEKAVQHVEGLDRADNCLKAILGFSGGIEARDKLSAEFLDTEIRSTAYIQHDSQLSGRVFMLRPLGEPIENLCDFDSTIGGGR